MWYTGEPDPAQISIKKPAGKKFPLHYNVATTNADLKTAVRQGIDSTDLFSTALEHYSMLDYTEKEKGQDPLFVEIFIKEKSFGGLGIIWTYLTWYFTAALIPAWTEDGYNIEYKAFRYDKGKKNYVTINTKVYDTTRWGFSWLVNIPFLWINLITYSKKDILSLTTQDYLAALSRNDEIVAMKLMPEAGDDEMKFQDTLVTKKSDVYTNVRVIQAVDTYTMISKSGKVTLFEKDNVSVVHKGN